MKKSGKRINGFYLLVLFTVFYTPLKAQDLPSIQKVGLWVPDNIKVDGKTNDWAGHFQAYNKNNKIYYTIANDKDKLYMVVKATDGHSIEKILGGGLTLIVKNTDKKNITDPLAITYPLLIDSVRISIARTIKNVNNDIVYEQNALNQKFTNGTKEIAIQGIKSIPDTLISIYNEWGITARALFDEKKGLSYELSVPLKFIHDATGNNSEFVYIIRLNGIKYRGVKGAAITHVKLISDSGVISDLQDLHSPTEFSGTYTIVKKND